MLLARQLIVKGSLECCFGCLAAERGEKSRYSDINIYIAIDIDILVNGLADHADSAIWGSVKAQARPRIDGSPFPWARKPPRQGALWWRQGAEDRKATKALNACGQYGDLSYA